MNIQTYAHPEALPASAPRRIARLLEIEGADIQSEVQLAQCIGAGLLPGAVTALTEVLGRNRVVGPVISEATFRRALKGNKRLSRKMSERLYEVGRVVDAVGRAYHGDREAIDTFLNRPHPLLDGQTPFDMARSNAAGADAVLTLLRRAEASIAL